MDAVPTKTVCNANNSEPTSETEIISKEPQIVQTDKFTANSSKSDANPRILEFTPVSECSRMGSTREESKLIAASAGSAMNVIFGELPVNAAIEHPPMNDASVESPMYVASAESPMCVASAESPMCVASAESPIFVANAESPMDTTQLSVESPINVSTVGASAMNQSIHADSLTVIPIVSPPELLNLSPATSYVATGVNVSAIPPVTLTVIPIGPPPELLHLSPATSDVAADVNVSAMPPATTIKSEPVSEEVHEATARSMELQSDFQNTLVKQEYIAAPQPSHVGFSCDYCEQEFNTESRWIRHVVEYHDSLSRTVKLEPPVTDGRSQYSCEICQKVFTVKSTLTAHMQTHSDDKPFRCDICQKAFKLKRYLTRHMNLHSGERPFGCHICQKAFREKSVLTVHMRIHSGERPFSCHICQK
eukprot:747257_1